MLKSKSKSKAHRSILLIPEHNIVSSELEKKSILKLTYKYAHREIIIPQLINILDRYVHDSWVVINSSAATTTDDNNGNVINFKVLIPIVIER